MWLLETSVREILDFPSSVLFFVLCALLETQPACPANFTSLHFTMPSFRSVHGLYFQRVVFPPTSHVKYNHIHWSLHRTHQFTSQTSNRTHIQSSCQRGNDFNVRLPLRKGRLHSRLSMQREYWRIDQEITVEHLSNSSPRVSKTSRSRILQWRP
jgi:hypothetical protein